MYTNCIITLIWSDGVNRTPPIMFTNDPKFRDDRITTSRRETIRSDCDALFEKYSISPEQVVWLGGSSHYVPESRALVERFRAMSQIPSESVIFHDKGNAFMDHGESIVPSLFGTKSATYPPLIHQF